MVSPVRVLVIGCGSIGALYDLDSTDIRTHVKAWYLTPNTDLTIYDIDQDLATQISRRYNCKTIHTIDKHVLTRFDCVSICSPTNTHFNLLEAVFDAKVPVVICEKPIALTNSQLEHLAISYQKSASRVMVNFIRRYQPSFHKLKKKISSLESQGEVLTNISIRYQRGFINNCSHALDLIEFLFDREVSLANVSTYNKIYDQFDNDPTLSMSAQWGESNFSVLGLSNVLFSLFEVEIYFKKHKISISKAGDLIQIDSSTSHGKALLPLKKDSELTDCLKDYMKFVVEDAIELINGSIKTDNFISAIKLNSKMLNYLDY